MGDGDRAEEPELSEEAHWLKGILGYKGRAHAVKLMIGAFFSSFVGFALILFLKEQLPEARRKTLMLGALPLALSMVVFYVSALYAALGDRAKTLSDSKVPPSPLVVMGILGSFLAFVIVAAFGGVVLLR